jgi:hypothetical protein
MGPLRIVGLVLVAFGIAVLAWGGIFWNDRDTVFKAGPLEVQTEDREGVSLPPVLGGISIVAGLVLVLLPQRSRV